MYKLQFIMVHLEGPGMHYTLRRLVLGMINDQNMEEKNLE